MSNMQICKIPGSKLISITRTAKHRRYPATTQTHTGGTQKRNIGKDSPVGLSETGFAQFGLT